MPTQKRGAPRHSVPAASTPTRSGVDAAVAELRLLGTELDRLDDAAAHAFGLARTDARALDIIHRLESVTPTELSRSLGYTSGGVTALLDRLEVAGFVQRHQHPSDRRQILIEPTAKTIRLAAKIYGPLVAHTQRIAGSYSKGDLDSIVQFLAEIRQATASRAQELGPS